MTVFHIATQKEGEAAAFKRSYECLVGDMEIELTGRRVSSGPKCCLLGSRESCATRDGSFNKPVDQCPAAPRPTARRYKP